MTHRVDPMIAANDHVQAFAEAHGLRVAVRDDGEVSLPLGPRTPQPAAICRTGRIFYSDHHASYGLRAGLWTIFVGPMTTRALSAVVRRWRSLGLRPTVLDFEAWVDVAEVRFLAVADAHPKTRVRRPRCVSSEYRRRLTARLPRGERPVAPSDPQRNRGSEGGNRLDATDTTSESSDARPAEPRREPRTHDAEGAGHAGA